MKKQKPPKTNALRLYREAERHVIEAGFGWEIDWQRKRAEGSYSERDLLRETAWVILCSGFREAAVRKCFNYISLCFCDWECAEAISHRAGVCVDTAIHGFRNRQKLEGIAAAAHIVHEEGFDTIKHRIAFNPIDELQRFPYIGPITSWHLAKNLGFPVAKNDRHLARMADRFGYSDAHEMCQSIARSASEEVSVVDVILWRFATLKPKEMDM